MKLTSLLTCLVVAVMACSASAEILYSEAFDNDMVAPMVRVVGQTDTQVDYVDYSTLSIPESPRMIAGSADTRGVRLTANNTDNVAQAVAVNLLATDMDGNLVNFSGDYRLSYDMYINVAVLDDGMGGLTLASGSTEQGLWGVGIADDIIPEGRNTRNSGTMGTWGWIAGENGYGTEDAAIFEDGTELADLGDTQLGEDVPFNMAFDSPILPGAPNNAPGNSWVRVDVDVVGGNVTVKYNDVVFFSEASAATDGAVMLGYEDPFSSITNTPEGMFGVFDNFQVTMIPEPSSACLLLLGLVTLVRRRK